MRAPFPYFGGKSKIADVVWGRFGDVKNYVEPFFGSGAVLLSRPTTPRIETVNDADGLLSNFWRAVQAAPEDVAKWADWPVNENDLHARHAWLVGQKANLQATLEGNPDYYDAKMAGWWLWGKCAWIGQGWCSGTGAWSTVDGLLVKTGQGNGVSHQIIHLGDAGQGINRQSESDTCTECTKHLRHMMQQLSDRLRRVRVCCGDWSRVTGPTVTFRHGMTGVFLDPPYAAGRTAGLYTTDSLDVAHKVREWAIDNGDNPLMRIALCGYEGEHQMPATWDCVAWKAKGGYGSQGSGVGRGNASRERIWFSPHCLEDK